jgi:hypothetical protein
VFEERWLVEGDFRAVNSGDDSLFRAGVRLALCSAAIAVLHSLRRAGRAVFRLIFFLAGRREDDAVSRAPAARRLFQHGDRRARLHRLSEFQPGARQRGAMHIPSRAATDDRRRGLLVHSFEVNQSNGGGDVRRHRLIDRADDQCRFRLDGRQLGHRLGGVLLLLLG